MVVNNEMRRWISEATPRELAELAEKARTTIGTLRQLAGGYRSGGRAAATSSLASLIELASKKLTRPGLAPVLRGDLSSACAGCDLYKNRSAILCQSSEQEKQVAPTRKSTQTSATKKPQRKK